MFSSSLRFLTATAVLFSSQDFQTLFPFTFFLLPFSLAKPRSLIDSSSEPPNSIHQAFVFSSWKLRSVSKAKSNPRTLWLWRSWCLSTFHKLQCLETIQMKWTIGNASVSLLARRKLWLPGISSNYDPWQMHCDSPSFFWKNFCY